MIVALHWGPDATLWAILLVVLVGCPIAGIVYELRHPRQGDDDSAE